MFGRLHRLMKLPTRTTGVFFSFRFFYSRPFSFITNRPRKRRAATKTTYEFVRAPGAHFARFPKWLAPLPSITAAPVRSRRPKLLLLFDDYVNLIIPNPLTNRRNVRTAFTYVPQTVPIVRANNRRSTTPLIVRIGPIVICPRVSRHRDKKRD